MKIGRTLHTCNNTSGYAFIYLYIHKILSVNTRLSKGIKSLFLVLVELLYIFNQIQYMRKL